MQGHDHWACVLQTSQSLAKPRHFMWNFQSQNILQLHYKVPICHFKNVQLKQKYKIFILLTSKDQSSWCKCNMKQVKEIQNSL
jgi:hypothetical protein